MDTTEAVVIEWAIKKLKAYDKEKKVYNISAITLSILDVLCGTIAIFYTSMIVTSIIASIICGTIWGGRLIQLIKAQQLAKALKVLSTASITYITVRKKRSEYMKNFYNNIKNNPFTILLALIGGGVMGFSSYKISLEYFADLPNWIYILIAVISSIVTVVFIVLLGWDSVKSAILRTAKKALSKEGYNALVSHVEVLKLHEAEQAEIAKTTAEHDKAIEEAKRLIEEHEKQNAAFKKAVELLAAMQATERENPIKPPILSPTPPTQPTTPTEQSILSDLQ